MTKGTIICIDDERIVLDSLKEQLRRNFGAAATIEIAESAEEALELFEELREQGTAVPLIICDQLMPGMKGDALLAAIYALDPRTLSVLLTGQASAEAVGSAVNRARLYRFIAKPWSEEDLSMTVREALAAFERARELEHKTAALERAHAASLRFVPGEFLRILGKERLEDVHHGDNVAREVTLFFSDMRAFTTLIEGKTPDDAFRFVNDYLCRMQEPIGKNGGFVSNIEGDAVLALFPGSAEDAVRAGVESQESLRAFNRERAKRGEPAVAMGVGVNTGPLILGVVGGSGRLQCDVVGDSANLAARIESLTKHYGAALLVSGSTHARLPRGSSYTTRLVDRVRVKGKSQPVELYEVLDALPEPAAQGRASTLPRFAEALASFCAGRLGDAQRAFEGVLEVCPEDGAARLHVARCARMREAELPPDWDGTVALDFK